MKRIAWSLSIIFCCAACCGHAGAGKRGRCASGAGEDVREASVVVEGVRFDVAAEPVESEAGLGVRVDVRISSDDRMEHWLEENPLIFEGSYTLEKVRYGFGQSGPVVIPPNRVQIKPGGELKFSNVLPAGARSQGIEKGESIEFTIKISGMITVDGSIVKPDVAHVEMNVSQEGLATISIRPEGQQEKP